MLAVGKEPYNIVIHIEKRKGALLLCIIIFYL